VKAAIYNDLTLSTNPPSSPPAYQVGNVAVEYFAARVPLASLNDSTARSPIVRVLVSGPASSLASGDSLLFADPTSVKPPGNARVAVWSYTVDTSPTLSSNNRMRKYAQFDIPNPLPAVNPGLLVVLAVVLLGAGVYGMAVIPKRIA
jgi:hypothetical protein